MHGPPGLPAICLDWASQGLDQRTELNSSGCQPNLLVVEKEKKNRKGRKKRKKKRFIFQQQQINATHTVWSVKICLVQVQLTCLQLIFRGDE